MIKWIRDHLTWSRSDAAGSVKPSDWEALNRISDQLANTVNETKDISTRIIAKLEDRITATEAKLSDREQLLGVVFDTIPDFLCLKDDAGEWKVLNAYGKTMFGLNRKSEYKGKTDHQIAEISEKYAQLIENSDETDAMAWDSGEPVNVEETFVDPDGNQYVFDVTKTPVFGPHGERKYLLVHGINITEYVKSTKHVGMLINALNHASDCIAVTDEHRIIIYANDSFCRTHGYELEEVLGQQMSFVGTDKTPIDTKRELSETISSGRTWTGVVINRRKNGETFPENITISPILNGKPYPIYYIVVKRSIDR